MEKIHWRYALKPDKVFIQPYADDEREYAEIEIIEADVGGEKSVRRLAEIIFHAIPYPMLLVFRRSEKTALFMGKIRSSQADGEKMTLEEMQASDWLEKDAPLWETMALPKMNAANFWMLYQNWFDVLSRYNFEVETGIAVALSGEEARVALKRLEQIEAEIVSLRAKMKKNRSSTERWS